VPLHVPRELRAAFSSLGQSLPNLWQGPTLRRAQKKALLRCLIDKVVAYRKSRECVAVRIVWRGGAVSEIDVPITVGSVRDFSNFEQIEQQILELVEQGKSDKEIADLLTEQGFRSPLRATMLPSTVRSIRLQHRRIHRYRGPRPRSVSGRLTLPQVAQLLGVTPHWLYNLIRRGVVEIKRDTETNLYLFPDRPETLEQLRCLKAGEIQKVSYGGGHQHA
jgi:predicted DNA-binding transcriptional regulator AlpA